MGLLCIWAGPGARLDFNLLGHHPCWGKGARALYREHLCQEPILTPGLPHQISPGSSRRPQNAQRRPAWGLTHRRRQSWQRSRERGKDGEKEEEKHQCVVAFHVTPTRDLACNPVHRLHGNRGGGHGSWAPARHPAPRRLQTPGLRPPRRGGPRGLDSEFPAPAPLRPQLQPYDFVRSQPGMANLGTRALGCASVPGHWHAGMRQETRAQRQDENTCGETPPRGSLH
nr:uncharacterized protein LOC128779353 [Desmodus rotundus]